MKTIETIKVKHQVIKFIYLSNKEIKYYDNKKVEYGTLAQNAEIDDITYKADNYIFLYKTGKVKKGYLLYETIINGINFRKEIWFHSNGKVSKGLLTHNTEIDGKIWLCNYDITFDKNGKVISGIHK